MARVCQITGKAPMVGNNVSHANTRTKRRFLPNLQSRRFWIESENRWIRLRVSNAALRLIDKKGIDVVLADLRARGEAFLVDEPKGGIAHAQADPAVLALDPEAAALQVRQETALRLVVRVRDVVADHRRLTGDLTDSGHGRCVRG